MNIEERFTRIEDRLVTAAQQRAADAEVVQSLAHRLTVHGRLLGMLLNILATIAPEQIQERTQALRSLAAADPALDAAFAQFLNQLPGVAGET